jgi:hypothetical protein
VIRQAATVFVASFAAIFAAACSAAPPSDGESVASSGAALSCTAPMTIVVTNSSGDVEDGTPVHVTMSCMLGTSAPVVPPDGYPANAIPSCAYATASTPPTALAGCTDGWRLSTAEGYQEMFLCPPSVPTPANPTSASAPTVLSPDFRWPQSVDFYYDNPPISNGCFGASKSSTYRLVQHVLIINGISPGNCGGNCASF